MRHSVIGLKRPDNGTERIDGWFLAQPRPACATSQASGELSLTNHAV